MKLLQLIGIIFTGVILASGIYAFTDDIELGGEKTRKPVAFPHEFHMGEFDCMMCHHDYDENKKNVLDEYDLVEDNPDILCGSCHKPNADIERREAFHGQCTGCHDQMKLEIGKRAPVMCGECHNKK